MYRFATCMLLAATLAAGACSNDLITTPLLFDPFATSALTGETNLVTSRVSAFKTSTGVELRFFMPVLNVPFRLIFAYNPQRAGVLDNSLQPQSAFQFRFAVGSTF